MSEIDQAYNALQIAAERIGANNYRAQYDAHRKAGRAKSTFRFTVTESHAALVTAMPQVRAGTLAPEDAMALLWGYDTMKERLGS